MSLRIVHPLCLAPPEHWEGLQSIPTAELVAWLNSGPVAKVKNSAPAIGKRAAKGGRVPELGDTYFKSTWEKNWARHLEWLKRRGELLDWSYEPNRYDFRAWYERGAMHYTPDFLLTYPDGRQVYHEVKGYLDTESHTKLKRYRKHYPAIPVVIVTDRPLKVDKTTKGAFETIDYAEVEEKLAGLIPGWEK